MNATSSIDLLTLLRGRRFLSMAQREYDWVITLSHDTQIVVACLWRLIETDRVRCTSDDHSQQFGLAAPVDAAAVVNRFVHGHIVTQVEMRAGIMDLELCLEHGWSLQIIPVSSGYEAWEVKSRSARFIALGGGEIEFRTIT